jgi:hypothetical protein
MITALDRALIDVCKHAGPPQMGDALINVADTLRLARMICLEHLPKPPANAEVLAVCEMILAERQRLVDAEPSKEE